MALIEVHSTQSRFARSFRFKTFLLECSININTIVSFIRNLTHSHLLRIESNFSLFSFSYSFYIVECPSFLFCAIEKSRKNNKKKKNIEREKEYDRIKLFHCIGHNKCKRIFPQFSFFLVRDDSFKNYHFVPLHWCIEANDHHLFIHSFQWEFKSFDLSSMGKHFITFLCALILSRNDDDDDDAINIIDSILLSLSAFSFLDSG